MYLPEHIVNHLQGSPDFQMNGIEVWLESMEDMPCLQDCLAALLKTSCKL
jgi:hypothetical protein